MENFKLDIKDVIKLVGFIGVVCSMWYDLKSDLRVFKATTELRLIQLEKDNERGKVNSSPQRFALVPNQTEIKDEY